MTKLDAHLDLRARHPDFQTFLDINEQESHRVTSSYPCQLNLAYGPAALQTMDIFPSTKENSPILIFIHGGYWRALDKKSYRFVAEPFVKQDLTVCVLNYRLIPTVKMEGLLNDIKDAIAWIQEKATQFNGDPNRLVLSGHSAGGHIALMTYLLHEQLRSSIQAICSISGIFDLVPIQNSYLNEVLSLTDQEAEQFSVSNKDLSVLQCPTFVSVGADETDLFIEQSQDVCTRNKEKAPIRYHEYPGQNHYQIIHRLGETDSPLAQFILQAVQ